MENIKLIAIDIDDTLLNDQKLISEENIKCIKKAYEKGIKVVLSSGRPLAAETINLYKKLGLYCDDSYYVGYNGEAIFEIKTKDCLYSNCLNDSDISYLESFFDKLDQSVSRYVHYDNGVKVINHNKYSYIEYLYNKLEYIEGDFNKDFDKKVHKYQLASDPDKIKVIFDNIPLEIKEEYSVVISMPCFIEFMKKGINKYQGILKVCEIFNIEEQAIMTIGDSMNDYEMIKNAKVGVAMGNAIDGIKKISKFVTKSNNDSGVSFAIDKFILF